MNLSEAIAQLGTMTNPSVEQLRTLVSQISVDVPTGTTRALYSGDLVSTSGQIINRLLKNDQFTA
jgi:hypothetical protein